MYVEHVPSMDWVYSELYLLMLHCFLYAMFFPGGDGMAMLQHYNEVIVTIKLLYFLLKEKKWDSFALWSREIEKRV